MSKKLLAFCASAFILLFFMLPQAPLASPQITIETEAGIQNKVKYDKGVPVRITLSNSGSDFSGDLVINYSETYNLGAGLAVPVELAAGETKTLQVAIPGLTDMYMMNGTQQQMIFLYEGGWENGDAIAFKGSKTLKANLFDPASLFIGTLTNNSDRLIALKELGAKGQGSVEVFHLNQLEQFALPREAMGWEFIDYLLIDEFAYGDLPEPVQEAVLQWVREGGHVVVGSTENMQLAMGNLSGYLPLQLGSSEQAAIPSLAKPVPAFEAELAEGAQALMESNGQVLAGRMPIGSGALTQTSFSLGDEPVASQEAYTAVMQNFFKTSAANQAAMNYGQPLKEVISYEIGSVNELFESFQVSKTLIISIILIYIVLIVPVLYIILKKKDKREMAWIAIPVAAVLVSVGLFAVGAKDRIANPQVQQTGFFIADPSGGLNGYYMHTLLSNRGGDYQFTAPASTSMTFSRSEEFMQQSPQKAAIVEPLAKGNSLTVRDMRYWSVGSIIGESYIEDAGNYGIQLAVENRRVSGTVKNNFPFALEDVSIWTGTRLIALGDLAPGEQLEVNAKIQSDLLAPAAQIGSGNSYQPIADVEELQKARKQSVLSVSYNEMDGEAKAPYIAGYAKDAIVPIALEGKRAAVSAVHLIAQPFEPEIKLSGEISLNSDAFGMDLTGTSATSFFEQISNDPYLYYLENGKYEMTYQLPKTLQGTATVWNELTLSSSKPGLTATLVHAKKGEAVELPNKQTVLTESVGDFITDDGTITIQLEMNASGNSPEVTVPKIKLKGEMAP